MFQSGLLFKFSGLRSVLPSGSPLEQNPHMDIFYQSLEEIVSDCNWGRVKMAADGRLLLMSKSVQPGELLKLHNVPGVIWWTKNSQMLWWHLVFIASIWRPLLMHSCSLAEAEEVAALRVAWEFKVPCMNVQARLTSGWNSKPWLTQHLWNFTGCLPSGSCHLRQVEPSKPGSADSLVL